MSRNLVGDTINKNLAKNIMTDKTQVQLTLTINAWNASRVAALAILTDGNADGAEEVVEDAVRGIHGIAEFLNDEPSVAIGCQDKIRLIAKQFLELADAIDQEIEKLTAEKRSNP